jgi:hypothetical protein
MLRLVYAFSLAILLADAALAAPPSGDEVASAVQQQFLAPFAAWQEEREEFSRADMPPSEMRVRPLDPQKDARGAEFVAFAVDARSVDGDWTPARFSGCVYTDPSAVYVKRGRAYLAAAEYFAQAATPHPGACASRD